MGPTIECPDCGESVTAEEVTAGISPNCEACSSDDDNERRPPRGGKPVRECRRRERTTVTGALVPVPV